MKGHGENKMVSLLSTQFRTEAYLDSIAYQVQTLAPEKASPRQGRKIAFDLARVNDIRNLALRISSEFQEQEDVLKTIDQAICKYGLDSAVSVFEALERFDAYINGCKRVSHTIELRKLELRLREIFDGDFCGFCMMRDYQPGISDRKSHPIEIADKKYHGGNYE
jgi:hypothetical protein